MVRDSMAGNMLAMLTVDLSLIPGTPYGPTNPPEILLICISELYIIYIITNAYTYICI